MNFLKNHKLEDIKGLLFDTSTSIGALIKASLMDAKNSQSLHLLYNVIAAHKNDIIPLIKNEFPEEAPFIDIALKIVAIIENNGDMLQIHNLVDQAVALNKTNIRTKLEMN